MTHFKRQNTLQTSVMIMLGLLLLASESAGVQGVVLPLPPEDQQVIAAQLRSHRRQSVAELAVLFRLKCEGKVGPAQTHDTAYYFCAPGKDVVAMPGGRDSFLDHSYRHHVW
jgi:hypothetical protein